LSDGDEISRPGTDPLATSPGEQRRAVVLFLATLVCVYMVYGFQWHGANPLVDAGAAWASAKFALALMAILLAHEMGHYLVARRHGFALSLPYFLPFPAAFGTFGAIIRLRSLPGSRTALLEMGAAGPLAGFVVAVAAIWLGLPGTVEHATPELVWSGGLEALEISMEEPTGVMGWVNEKLSALLPEVRPGELQLMILANPPVMDLLGELVLGQAPGRYASLDPLAMAGWVGCLLTAINLLPIGQLDGGHIFNALAPSWSGRLSKVLLVVAFIAGWIWAGWAFWAVLLLVLGAWVSLPVPHQPGLTRRARVIAVLALLSFLLTFMHRPIDIETMPLSKLALVDADGEPLDPVLRQAIDDRVAELLADHEAAR
jgi:membrane-associated protease RseP (regulator of RpoE activity)